LTSHDPEHEPAEQGADELLPPERASRAWTIAAAVLVTLAVASLGTLGYLLFRPASVPSDAVLACVPGVTAKSDSKSSDSHPTTADCPPPDASSVVGLVDRATDTGFVIKLTDGGTKTIAVRPADRPYVDVQHARSHASLGLPVRVYTKQVDDEDVIIYLVDAPLDL
jgi:hypothetical protein